MQTMYSPDRRQLVETTTLSFFESMLQMPVWPVDAVAASQDTELCTARVCMLCRPTIEVFLHLTESQAFKLTERLMKIPQPTAMNEDVCDTMREIVNVIGGNLKASLAEGKQLTIAEVLDNRPVPFADDSSEVFAFESAAGVFWISLHSSLATSEAAPQEEALLAS